MAAEDVFGIVGTTQAGNFHIERVVAEGGFGVVYRALHGGFRAPVAIKCLKIPEQMSDQARDVFLEKFREEAELMFRLSAAITEVCRPLHVDVLLLADGRFVPFLAMEWLEGESLDAIVTRRREQGQPPLGLHKVVKMLRPVALALHKAHRFPGPQGAIAIIHRDLKPENLMVATIAGVESMKILDFGIAKAKRAATQAVGRLTGRHVAEDEMASFTPAYGAPEQWVPKTWGETGPWTDVWGLALTMVEALTGSPPIDGEPWAMRRICLDEKRRPTPKNHGTDVPAEVEKVFEQALALDPRKRYKTIEAFWSELERAMGLPPTLGKRDDRREPGEHCVEEDTRPPAASPAAAGRAPDAAPGAPRGRVELARIALQPAVRPAKAPLVAMAPPTPRAPGAPSATWEFDLAAATGARAEDAAPAPSPRAVDVDVEPPRKAGRDGGRPPIPPAEALAAPPAEPPAAAPQTASPKGAREAAKPAAPEAGPALPAAPAPAAPAVRRSSGELELDLPTRGDPSPEASSLEMSLPTRGDGPPLAPVGRDAGSSPIPATSRAPEPAGAPPRTAAAGAPLDFDLQLPARAEAPAPLPAQPTAASTAPRGAPISSSGSFALAPPSSRRTAPTSLAPPEDRAPRTLRERLLAPLGMLLAALLVAAIDLGYHRLTGGDLTFGPVRPFWIAAPLALFGVGFTLWRMMEGHGDE